MRSVAPVASCCRHITLDIQSGAKAARVGLLGFVLAVGLSSMAVAQTPTPHPLSEILVSGPEFSDIQPD